MITFLQEAMDAILVVSPVVLPLLPARSRQAPRVPSVPRESILGVHGRMTDEVERWKIGHSVDMMVSMGATWLVEYFPWAYMEPSRGRFDWAHADMVIDAAATRGLRVIARLDVRPFRPPRRPRRPEDRCYHCRVDPLEER